MKVKIRASYDSFRTMRESNAYYVDKTDLIKEYLEDRFEKAVLFARPRRFGKTITMTMFRDFLDIRQDSRDIFQGLKIMNTPEVVEKYMNRYPVIFMSLKEVHGEGINGFHKMFKSVVSTIAKQNDFLLVSEGVNRYDKELLEKLMRREGDVEDCVEILGLLSRMLHTHFEMPCFVLIDEYDVPMAKALGTEAYEQVRDMIELMLSFVCKTNDDVQAVMLSGCLFTVKNSTYTGVNNIIPYTVLSPIYAASIGFTDGDVRKLLSDAGLSEQYDTVSEWYDGYLFGREKMYCPWDVLRYVNSVLDGSYSDAMGPESYWVNTSETSLDIIHGFLGKTNGGIEVFEQLLAGKTYDCKVTENLPYHRLYENGENLWSALVETGYLTKAVTERMPVMPVRIPNKSVQDVFRQEVWNYFRDRIDNVFVSSLADALWAEENEQAEGALNQILEATLSFYHAYREYSYHLILDGFFTGLGYRVLSELETGYGRSDLIILDPAQKRCLILELKHVRDASEVESALQEAASQILERKYESTLKYHGYVKRVQYALAFFDKRARVLVVKA